MTIKQMETMLNSSFVLKGDDSRRPFRIEYKRFHECLVNATNFPPDHAALSFKGIVKSVYDRLETSVLPCTTTAPAGAVSTQQKPQTGTAAMRRKSFKATAKFELIHAHNPGSFQQRLIQNTKFLQIGLFLMDFIFGRSAQ